MKYNIKSIILGLVFVLTIIVFASIPKPTAASYNGGNIIDNAMLLNASTMSADDIQKFLISMGSGLSARTFYFDCAATTDSDPYYRNAGAPCEQTVLASQIIYYASQIYSINPQAVLATLQKEQSLITTANPTSGQINYAMGFGCPTTGTCATSNFLSQIDNGVWTLRLGMERARGNMTWFYTQIKPWTCSYEHSPPEHFYSPNLYPNQNVNFYDQDNVRYATHYIANTATSSFYCYTPHAYNNPDGLYGLPQYGTTGRYYSGWYNFVYYFEKWFGSTTSAATYGYSLASKEIYSDDTHNTKISSTSTVEPNQVFYVIITIENTGNQVWHSYNLRLGGTNPENRGSVFATDDWICAGRPASMNENFVEGGETATFTFAMKAPPHLGSYTESFGVLIEGDRWLDGELTIPITVASSNTSYYSVKTLSFNTYSDSAMTQKIDPSKITKYTDSKIYAKTVIKNTGNKTLPAGLTRLSASNPIDRTSPYSNNSWLDGRSRAATAQEGDILPQGIGTFTFLMTTPSTPLDRIQEQFGLLIEYNQWLSYSIGSISVQTIQRPLSFLGNTAILNTNESLLSNDERYMLILQGDGNLVLYNEQWKALWASWTVGKGGTKLIMQDDGNLVLYTNKWVAVWDSKTAGKGRSSVYMQSDGNLVIYNAKSYTWASWTVGAN